MGQMKRVMEDREAAVLEAEEIAIHVGWMERCDIHDEVSLDDESARGHAYALANWRVKNSKSGFTGPELKEALDTLEQNVGDCCSSCRNYERRDD